MNSQDPYLNSRKALIKAGYNYYIDPNIHSFARDSYSWFLHFIRKRITNDPEMGAEYYAHIYQKLPSILERYLKYKGHPFAGFMSSYLRNEYNNFYRMQQRKQQIEAALPLMARSQRSLLSSPPPETASMEISPVKALRTTLRTLPHRERMILLLYYGMEIEPDDLRTLLDRFASVTELHNFIALYRTRGDRIRKRQQSVANYSNKMLVKLYTLGDQKSGKLEQIIRKKQKNDRKHAVREGYFSCLEISLLLQISKSQVSRIIQAGKLRIRSSMTESFPEAIRDLLHYSTEYEQSG